MDKQEILKQYKSEDKLLVAKVLDKLEYCNKYGKISNTGFINEREISIVKNVLNKLGISNYVIYGGYVEAQRRLVIFYPNYFDDNMLSKNYNVIMQVIEINLPHDLQGKYSHRDYLSGLMKLGIAREKIGDILVEDIGADIIILKEITAYVEQNIATLTRFSKSQIRMKSLEELKATQIKKEELNIIVPSLRLDNIVSELAKISRSKANNLILQERVLINYEIITKNSKLIKEDDIITIRGKGKFHFIEQIGETKKENKILKIEKYV